MQKDQIHNLIILDESGSMASAYEGTIDAFNHLLNNIKSTASEFEDQEHKVTFVSFNTSGRKYVSENCSPENIEKLSTKNYRPDGGTPLLDTIGFAVHHLRNQLENQDAKVLVTIFTDGNENASREFSGPQIHALVESMEAKGWTFTYIGAEHDVQKAAMQINIKNVVSIEKNKNSMMSFFTEEASNRRNYYQKVREKQMNLKDDYFKNKN